VVRQMVAQAMVRVVIKMVVPVVALVWTMTISAVRPRVSFRTGAAWLHQRQGMLSRRV
jgi:hypothetical protein